MKFSFKSFSLACVVAVVLTACGGGGSDSPAGGPPLVVDAEGDSAFDATALGTTLAALSVQSLSAAESTSLTFMREEEKLAQDVYTQLATVWGSQSRVFGNIARSEATHTEAVRQLLMRYSLPDPAATLTPGLFQNTTLQGLYTELVAAGTPALMEALKVGAAIEEIDMIDLNRALLEIDNPDIVLVYQNLLKGSRNHLRAFVNALAAQGVTYAPQYMTAADYQAIISTPTER
ncbi:MAG: DUF2202 domain-containing protein [Rhodoferax sp.]